MNREHVAYLQCVDHEAKAAVEGLPALPAQDDREAEGELHHLDVVDAKFVADVE